MAATLAQPPSAAPVTRYQGVDKQSSGYKLLFAMGWKEGEGLGASRQGIKEHIKIKKKFENWGVGAVEAAEKARDWTTGMLDFHRVLSTLSEVTSQHAKRGESGYDSGSESEQSDASDGGKARRAQQREEEDASGKAKKKKKGGTEKPNQKGGVKKGEVAAEGGVGGVEGETKADKKKKKKKKKKEKKKEKELRTKKGKGEDAKRVTASQKGGGSDSGSGSNSGSEGASGEEEEAAAAPAPKRVKFATHVGRFKRREAAKMVKHYSSTDLAAILGEGGGGAAAAVDPAFDMVFPTVEVRAERPADSSDSDGGCKGVQEGGAGAAPCASLGAASSGGAPSGGLGGDSCQSDGAPLHPAVLPEEEGKWWAGYFGRAQREGGVGASGRPSITVHGFREQDQENLYNMAQDGKTQGRVGLGRSSMPKKVAGTRWQGKNTRLGSDSEDEGEAEEGEGRGGEGEGPGTAGAEQAQQGGEQPHEVHLGNGVVVILPPSKREQLTALLGQQAQHEGGGKEGGGKSKRRGGGKAEGKGEGAGAGTKAGYESSLAGLKWRKLVLSQLRGGGKGKLSVGKLSRAIMKERGLSKAVKGRVEALVAEAAAASSKLALQEGVVSLA